MFQKLFLLAFLFVLSAQVVDSQNVTQREKLIEAFDEICKNYVDTVDQEKLVDEAISAMVHSLDSHSNYWNSAENERIRRTLESKYLGFGMALFYVNDTLTVTKIIPNSPSEKANVKVGDKILEIDQTQVSGVNGDNNLIRSLLESEKKTLDFLIQSADNQRVISITKGKVEQHSISDAVILSNGMGVVKIDQFGASTGEEFHNVMRQFMKEKVTNLMIDLRGNSGGYVYAVREIMENFLKPKTELFRINRRGKDDNIFITREKFPLFSGKIMIISDKNTASASEILMLVMKEKLEATFVGEATFGKSLVQSAINFSDHSSINLSTGRWETAMGRSVSENGIEPDIAIEMNTKEINDHDFYIKISSLLR